MAIDVNVLGKYKMAYGTEVEVSYTCHHCGENIIESICFSDCADGYIADICDHECPECGECNDLDIDLY